MNLYLKTMRLFIFFAILFCVGCQENNFSDAALEECWLLDKSLLVSNQIMERHIENTMRGIEGFARSRNYQKPIFDKAIEIQALTAEFQNYIDTLRSNLVAESGGIYTKKEVEIQGKPELEGRLIGEKDKKVPHQIFLSGGYGNEGNKAPQGAIIQKKALELRDTYIKSIESLWDNGSVKGTIFADPSKKAVCIEDLKEEMAFSNIDNYRPESHGDKTWAEFTFENMPVGAIYAMLRQLQNNIIISESAIINFLAAQQSYSCYYPNEEVGVLAIAPKSNIRLGETYQADIVVWQSIVDAITIVTIDSQTIESREGVVAYKVKSTSIGTKKYTAKIALKNRFSGEIETFTKDFHYEVSP